MSVDIVIDVIYWSLRLNLQSLPQARRYSSCCNGISWSQARGCIALCVLSKAVYRNGTILDPLCSSRIIVHIVGFIAKRR